MEYTFKRAGNEVTLQVALTAKEWEEQVQHAYEHERAKYSIPGFRKGKVPRKILEKNFGEGVFYDHAFNHAFNEYYGEILDKEKSFEPVAQPEVDVEEIDKDKGVKFTAVVTVKPEIILGEYTGLKVKKTSDKVAPEEIDREVERAQERAARMVPIENRAAQKGDTVNIDYSGAVDGVKFEGGTAEKQDLTLGSNTFIPGFEEQVEGMNIGEEKDVTVKFPEDYHAAELAGKNAVFKVKLHGISLKELPELDDEFAKDVSEFETLLDFRSDIAQKLKENKVREAKNADENAILTEIAKRTKIDIPECMINEQIDHYFEEFKHRLQYQYGGMKIEDYYKATNTDEQALRAARREEAERTVKLRLTIEEIIKREQFEPEQEEIEARIADAARKAGKTSDKFRKEMTRRQFNFIINDIMMDKVLAFLTENNEFEK